MDICFEITDIQTATFPIPSRFPTAIFKSRKGRRFYVSVTDGRITKDTTEAPIEGLSLHWNETLDGFTLDSSSQLTLRVFEKNRVLPDDLLAAFVISYETLRSSQNVFLLQSTDQGFKKKSPTREITVKVSKCTIAEFGPGGLPVSHKPTDTVKNLHDPSSSVVDKAKDSHSRFQEISHDVKNGSSLAVGIVGGSDSIVEVLNTTDVMITPLKGFLHKWDTIRHRLDIVVRAVDTIADIHPYAKLAWSVISFVPMQISEQIQLDRDVVDLLDVMEHALDLAPDADTLNLRCKLSKNHEKTLILMMDQISECGRFVQSYVKDVNFWKRFMKNMTSNGKAVVEKFRETLEKLRDNFLSEVIVAVEINVFRMLAELESITGVIKGLDLDLKLRELPYGVDTGFDPGKGCLPRTRLKFIDAIVDWVNNPDPSSPKVLVLSGQAGKGKSSIAHEIARQFHDTGRLTTSYFFVRGNLTQREPYRFFTTLARDLCDMYPAFKISIGKAINNNTKLRYARDYLTLFQFLLQNPLNDVRFVGPVLVIIDALDESEDASDSDLASGNTLAFHTFLGQHLSNFPSPFRILITSRPEPNVLKAFPPSPFVRHIQMDDEDLADEIEKDILIYMRTKLSEVNVDDIILHKLVKKAEGLFQWASVACHYIANPPRSLNFEDCIDRVLHPSDGQKTLNPLDSLYMTVLEDFDMDDLEVLTRFHSVMRQIFTTFEPLSIVSLDTLGRHVIVNGAKAIRVHDVVKHLASLLSNVSSSSLTLPIEPLHTSFRDFLTDPKRSGKFYVNLDNTHYQLAYATLRTMQEMLHFNMCQLETSYQLNREVPDLNDRIQKSIPSALSYSCRFWANHLMHVSELDINLFDVLQVLMKENFLFWLEVLSVMGEMSVASTSLLSLRVFLGQRHHRNEGIEDFDALVMDAVAFVRYFGYPIAQSVPHIYLSALPFTPSTSAIAKLYSPRFAQAFSLERGRLVQWPALLLTTSVPQSRVVCVALSRDDKHIAAGMIGHGGSIYIWDASTGMVVSGPFRTRNKLISSVVFSYDGQYLASGLWNGEIGIWEVKTGRAAIGGQKLTGHTDAVSSLSFSEDGQQLVSGSGDCTVRIWDLETGKALAGPFYGHNNPVWEVSFLPDNKHILSRSGTRTVRIWNIKTGENVKTPFKFDEMDIATGTVHSAVHYSDKCHRDLLRVKSNFFVCSWTKAIRAEEMKHKPQGWYKDYWVQATAFSARGRLVATCSSYHIDVWHATGPLAGNIAGGPYISTGVTCLAFSIDEQRIVSGSKDGIVRVWNVRIVDEHLSVSAQSQVPASVAFIPDGKRIVVGSQYGTIQVLDLSTGQVMSISEADEKGRWVKVAVSTNGERIASTAGNAMRIWSATGEAVMGPLIGNHRKFHIDAVAFSPDSNDLLACSTSDRTVHLWNVSTGVPLGKSNKICDSELTSLALSPSTTVSAIRTPTRIAVGSHGKTFVWNTQTGDITGPFTHHNGRVRALVFAADGKYITSVADDCTWCLWDSTNGMVVRGPVVFSGNQKMNLHNSRPSSWSFALTQDGRKVAFIGKHHTILTFEVLYKGDNEAVPQGPLLLAGHANQMNMMAFSRDGRHLASTSSYHIIRVWDLQAAAERKNARSNETSDEPEITELADDTFIDNDGWAFCTNDRGGPPFRLMWVPEIHRAFIPRPSSVFAGVSNETRLDLRKFVYGKDWVKCKT